MDSEFPPTNPGWPPSKPDPSRQSFFEAMGGEVESSAGPDDASGIEGLALSSSVEDWGMESASATPPPLDRTSNWLDPIPQEQGDIISDAGLVPRRHVVESVTEKSIALSPNSSSSHDDGWLQVSCPQCHGELEIHTDQLGVSGSCLWCETPLQAIRSANGEVIASVIEAKKETEISEETPRPASNAEAAFLSPGALLPYSTEEAADSPNPWESGFSPWETTPESHALPEASDSPEIAETDPVKADGYPHEASTMPASIWGAPLEEFSTPVSDPILTEPDETPENIFSPVTDEGLTAVVDYPPDMGFGGFLQRPAEPAAEVRSEPVVDLVPPVPSVIHPVPSLNEPGSDLDFGQNPSVVSTEQRIFGKFAESATLPPASPPSLPQPQPKVTIGLPPLTADPEAGTPMPMAAPPAVNAGQVHPGTVVVPKPKNITHTLRTALLVIVFGFVCGIALASFVLPTEEYANRARVFLDQFMAPQLQARPTNDPSRSGEAADAPNPVAPPIPPASGTEGPVKETPAGPPKVTVPTLPVTAP